ncbi:unnamed protein product, partial [Prorocentrum cordatum]
ACRGGPGRRAATCPYGGARPAMARDRSGGSRSRRRREPRPARGGSRSRSRLCRERKARKRDKEKAVPHFSWKPGMCLGTNDRYVVEQFLGDGTFGRVLGCKDSVAQDYVAVKVVKGVKRYCEHAEAEVEILQEIQRLDPRRESLCVEMLDSFLHAERCAPFCSSPWLSLFPRLCQMAVVHDAPGFAAVECRQTVLSLHPLAWCGFRVL